MSNPLVMTPAQLAQITGPHRAVIDQWIEHGWIVIDRSHEVSRGRT